MRIKLMFAAIVAVFVALTASAGDLVTIQDPSNPPNKATVTNGALNVNLSGGAIISGTVTITGTIPLTTGTSIVTTSGTIAAGAKSILVVGLSGTSNFLGVPIVANSSLFLPNIDSYAYPAEPYTVTSGSMAIITNK